MFKNDARFTHSSDPDGRRALALVKPDEVLFAPKPGDHLFKGAQQIPEKGQRGPFRLGLPEKEISLPDPLVQQAIARTLAGVSSKGFQLLTPKTMAEVNQLAKTAPRSKAEEREAEAAKAKDAKAKALVAKQEQEAAAAGDTEAGKAKEQQAPEALASDSLEAEAIEGTQEAQEAQETGAITEASQALDASDLAEPSETSVVSDPADPLAGAAAEAVADAEVRKPDASLEEGQSANETESKKEPAPAPGPLPEGMQLVSAADIQQMFDEAFAQGQEAVLKEAEARMQEAAAAIEQERQAIEDEAYQRGYDEGHAKAEAAVRDELQAEVELAAEDLRDLTARMAESARDTDSFYAPLLKLSMHLAEQLVRGELTVSSAAIERLIQTCLEEFGQETVAPIMVRLNPQDLAGFQKHEPVLPPQMTLKADPSITQGGVRVQMNGAMVEDLIEERADRLWSSLTSGLDAGAPPTSFLQNVERVKEAFDAVDSVLEATEGET